MKALRNKFSLWIIIGGTIILLGIIQLFSGCAMVCGAAKGAGQGIWQDTKNTMRWIQEPH